MLKKCIQIITSLKLTVGCLVCSLILIFVGTLAQVNLGLYLAMEVFYQSFFISAHDFASFHPAWPDWPPGGENLSFPVFPGGKLIGGTLLINLIASHFVRFKWTKKRSGIFLTHVGLIILLFGQIFTEMFQVESSMRIEEGKSKNYSESYRKVVLAVIETSHEAYDQATVFPESHLEADAILSHANFPFEIKVKEYHVNSDTALRPPRLDPPADSLQGVGRKVTFSSLAEARGMNDKNIPTSEVEIVFADGQVKRWFVSLWQADVHKIRIAVQGTYDRYSVQFGPEFGRQMASVMKTALDVPQAFEYEGRQFQIWLRPVRYYKDFSITLKEFRHDRYLGTSKAKNFSSRVRLDNPEKREQRDILIRMNSPLRYQGETYFQSGYFGDAETVLQVVRNPSWLVPYVSCVLVGVGLIIQFLIHLFAFIKKKKRAT